MKRHLWLPLALLAALNFAAIIYMGIEKVKTRRAEISNIRKAAESVVRDYLNHSTTAPVVFTSFPICYAENSGWINSCYIDLPDETGKIRRIGFDIIVRQEGRLWKTSILKIYDNRPISEKTKKAAP